jgi:PAS domain S-box-containing protein
MTDSGKRSKNILLVEDEAILALSEKAALERYGYAVTTVDSGEQAVQAMADSPADFDLVLMDINLGSGMDGTEAAALILKQHDLPVIFLSSHTNPDVVGKTEKITSYGYVVKCSSITVLDASIKMAFRLHDAHIELGTRKQHLDTALRQYEQLAEELAGSEEKYRALFDQSFQGIYLHDLDGCILDVNQTACEQSGYSREELLKMRVFDLHPGGPDTGNLPRDEILRLWRDWAPGQRITVLADHQRRDGSVFPIENITGPVHFGKRKLILAIVQDISERKKAEELVRVSEESLRTTLDSIGDAVLATDPDGRITRMNPVAERLCGWNLQDALGRPLEDVFHIVNAGTREAVANPVLKVLRTGTIVGLANHTVLLSRDGREYQIADSAAPIRDTAGRITGVVLVFRDVTEQYGKDRPC